MRTLSRTLLCLALIGSMAGCGIVYKPDVHQGNLLAKDKVKQLKPGLTKRQVVALLGTPSVTSPFQHDRWDYVQEVSHRGGKPKLRTLTLYFNNDTLTRTEGKFLAESPQDLLKAAKNFQGTYPTKTGPKGDKETGNSGDSGPSP